MIKHFLDLNSFSKIELRKILDFAKKLKKNQIKYSNQLQNKSLGLLFEKQSTRTRLSFSIGVQNLGGNLIELDQNQIGFGTRESTEDILKVLSQYIDVLMIRNNDHKQLLHFASLNVLPIINGLSNLSHPCQILSDIFTIEEFLGKIKNKNISWIGDYNNVLISLIQASEIFEFNLNVIIPKLLFLNFNKMFDYKKLKYVKFFHSIDQGIKNTDCVMTDAWISMGEKNSNKKKNLLKKFQVNDDIMKKTKNNAIFMHCLPAHRNEEVTDSVIDGTKSVVWQQAKNRMYVQQSILNYLIK